MKKIETYGLWSRQPLRVSQLYLDPENIRLEIDSKNQDAIMADLFVNERAYDILKSIIDYGWLPDETPVVVLENSKYYIIEGNRRVAALKAIANPKLLPREFELKTEKITKGFTPVNSVEVLLAPSRSATERYLASKHTRNTRRPWTALRRAYFYYAQIEKGQTVSELIDKYPDTDIPKYVRMYEMHKAALSLQDLPRVVKKKVENKREFDISTLERLYTYRFVQSELGIVFDSKTGEVSIPTSKEFNEVYAKIIEDVVRKYITSRKRINTEKNAKKYLDEIKPKAIDTKVKIKVAEIVTKPVGPATRKPLFPKTLICTIEDAPGIERRLDELQRIDYYDLQYASLDSLRSFVETAVKKYLSKIGQSPAKSGKYAYLEGALKRLKALVEGEGNTEVAQVIDFILKDKVFLDAVNHNPSFIAVDREVKEIADRVIELIQYIFKKYEDDKNKNS